MAAEPLTPGQVHATTVFPRGEWYQRRENYRVFCPHGEILWSAGGSDGWMTDADVRRYRRVHLAEAAIRLREKTGCSCEVPT